MDLYVHRSYKCRIRGNKMVLFSQTYVSLFQLHRSMCTGSKTNRTPVVYIDYNNIGFFYLISKLLIDESWKSFLEYRITPSVLESIY